MAEQARGGLRAIAALVTVAGIVVLAAAEFRLTGGDLELGGVPLYVWPVVPFALGLFGLREARVRVARSVGVTMASAFGLAMYADLLLTQRLSSTAGLALLFIPLWQLIAYGVVLVLTARRGGGDRFMRR